MRRITFTATLLSAAVLIFGGLKIACAQNSPQIAIANSDWAGTDALGRTLPTYRETGGPKPNRWVGMFYWEWHGPDRWGPNYDVTKFLKTHPKFQDFEAHPKGGPDYPTWYWGEPLFGYYRSTDPWVIRKQIVMLADAGVDFLFLDYTNGSIYDPELKTFLDVAEDLKSKGVAVPRLTFFLNSEPEWKVEKLYTEWYKPGKYDDLWFQWQGKPLLMSPQITDGSKLKDPALLPGIQSYFTWRPTWAFHDATKPPTQWNFLDNSPQHPSPGPNGKVEQIVVSKSLGGPINTNMTSGSVSSYPGHVPVYNDQWVSPDAAKGLFFQYQWDKAASVGAPILLVTGWNEWTASVWETPGVPMLGRVTQKGQGHIVDEFNQEFNRDLEPMRGGYGDDYYCQFVEDMRRYKGMLPPEAPSASVKIAMNGPLTQWNTVRPLYQDTQGDTANRDWDAAVPKLHYTNTSARNDIVSAQIARSKSTLYFHVRTAKVLTPASDKNWMLLFVNTDANAKTGWHGYDFLINRRRTSQGSRCTVERNVGGKWAWRPVGEAALRGSGRDLVLAVPRSLFGVPEAHGPLTLDFKWADNIPASPDIMDFYTQGDAAPDGRFNYRFAEPSLLHTASKH